MEEVNEGYEEDRMEPVEEEEDLGPGEAWRWKDQAFVLTSNVEDSRSSKESFSRGPVELSARVVGLASLRIKSCYVLFLLLI